MAIRTFKRFFLYSFVLFVSACAGDIGLARKAEVDILRQESYAAKRDVAELKRSVSALQNELSELRKNTPSEESLGAIRQSQTSLFTQVSELLKESQLLRGRFDEYKFFMDKRLKEIASDSELLKARSEGASGAGDIKIRVEKLESELRAMQERLSSMQGGAETPQDSDKSSPEKTYEAALALFKERKYPDARKMLESLLKEHPSHSLAGNARFWVGETYYEEKDYDNAILTYEEVLEKHKKSPKAPAAMLKQAYAFLELRDRKAARGILKELVDKYPDTEQAKAAAERLKKLKD